MTVTGLFFSCQREEGDPSFASDTTISVQPNTKAEVNTDNNTLLGWVALTGKTDIPAEEAQATALATAMQMRKVEGIVTKAPLQIGSVEVVKGDTRKPYVATKGSKPEPADVYIINFANNQGYVVTSGDRRVPGVLAYNSYGHLGDTISNPGQAVLFSYMQAYIEEQREAFEANKEKLATQAEEALFKKLSKERQAELIARGYFDKQGKRVKSKFLDLTHVLCQSKELDKDNGNNHSDDFDEDRGRHTGTNLPKKNGPVLDPEATTYGEWTTEYIKAPLLKTLWGQSGEYNDKVGVYCEADHDQSPVGCVATAIGQLIAYHKKPAIFKDRVMHWDDMTKIDRGDMFSSIYSYAVQNNPTAKEDIQYLLAHLGDSDLLDMDYGCADIGSGSNIYKALHTLKLLGFNNAFISSLEAFPNFTNEIQNNRPVYIRGCETEISHSYSKGWWFWKKNHIDRTYTNCHAWVLDGYVLKKRKVTEQYIDCPSPKRIEMTHEEKLELVHNNFGWGGYRDGSGKKIYPQEYDGTGWYMANIFDSKSGRKAPSNSFKSGEQGNFKYDLKIITNIE